MNKKKTLSTYMDVVAVIKSQVTSGILEASSTGKININTEDLPRLISLIESMIETSGANGYEALSRVK